MRLPHLLQDRRMGRRTIGRLAFLALAALGAGAAGACLAVSPPALPEPGLLRPTILHDAVVPPADIPLVQWPDDGTFTVPVEVDEPGEPFYFDVFIDYDPGKGTGNVIPPRLEQPASDGGIVLVSFTIATPPDPRFCHLVEFLVAESFNQTSLHTPDSLGGDIVSWYYTAGGGPNGCPAYDAGAFEDGAFPPSDAGIDGLPVASGGTSP